MSSVRSPRAPRRCWIVVCVVAGTILYYSVVAFPTGWIPDVGLFELAPTSTWLHLAGYATLTAIVVVALAERTGGIPVLPLAFVVVVAYGIGIEALQSSLADRTFSYHDMGLNAIGAGVATLGWAMVRRRRRGTDTRTSRSLGGPFD